MAILFTLLLRCLSYAAASAFVVGISAAINLLCGSPINMGSMLSYRSVLDTLLDRIPLLGKLINSTVSTIAGVGSGKSGASPKIIDAVLMTLLFASLFKILDLMRRFLDKSRIRTDESIVLRLLTDSVCVPIFSVATLFSSSILCTVILRIPFISSADNWVRIALLAAYAVIFLAITYVTSSNSIIGAALATARTVSLAAVTYSLAHFHTMATRNQDSAYIYITIALIVITVVLSFLDFNRLKKSLW